MEQIQGESNSLLLNNFTLSPANSNPHTHSPELSRGVLLGIAIYLTIIGKAYGLGLHIPGYKLNN